MKPPFNPQSIEAMRARFGDAIFELMHGSTDRRILEPKHFFDFYEKGEMYRLNICRDVVCDSGRAPCDQRRRVRSREIDEAELQSVTVIGTRIKPPLMPVTVVAARVALLFHELTEGKYGDGEVIVTGPNTVGFAYYIENVREGKQ